ncbi:hypothetical protein F2Q69_00053034 [Brassica cretica]|uniref:Uncharacterized protein n=1 Tax=Brassica cretica TaxID=69181 RepID=A0A8S9N8P2_BRACR|nr:hypothetical protein F2Q69_00053034 [Brassica cretica]
MFYTLEFIDLSFSIVSSPKNPSCAHPHTSIFDLSAHHGDVRQFGEQYIIDLIFHWPDLRLNLSDWRRGKSLQMRLVWCIVTVVGGSGHGGLQAEEVNGVEEEAERGY